MVGDVDFSIALVDADGNLSAAVPLKSVAVVRWPGGTFAPIEMFQTVRVALSAFPGVDRTRLRGVRFAFDRMGSRSIYLGNVRLTQAAAGPGGVALAADAPAGGIVEAAVMNDINRIVAVRRLASGDGSRIVEVELSSNRRFPIGGALPELRIGPAHSRLSRPVPGNGSRLVFVFRADAFDAAGSGAVVSLRIGGAPAWSFGTLTP